MSDMYPHDPSFYADTPIEQKIEEQKTKSKVKAGLAILEDIITRLESRIIFYDTLDSIPDEVIADPDEFRVTVAANKLTKRSLEQELAWFTTLKETYK